MRRRVGEVMEGLAENRRQNTENKPDTRHRHDKKGGKRHKGNSLDREVWSLKPEVPFLNLRMRVK